MADGSKGRKPGFRMSEAHRVKIQNSNILNALIEHVEGQRKMTATQVSAGLGLLKKVLPDLASVEHSGPDGGPIRTTTEPRDMTSAELAEELKRRGLPSDLLD